jgi:hypothetical protein
MHSDGVGYLGKIPFMIPNTKHGNEFETLLDHFFG